MTYKESTPRFLVVTAHPDDSILTAGKILKATSSGHRVDEAVFTRTSDARLDEEREAMNILGMDSLYPIGDDEGWDDGTLAMQARGLLVASLVGLLDRAVHDGHPYTDIVTMHGSVTGHSDHAVVSEVARAAFHRSPHAHRYWGTVFTRQEHQIFTNQYGPKGYFVPVPNPPKPRPGKYRALQLSPEEIELKRKAAWAHTSQLPDVERHDERFRQLAENGGVVELYRYHEKNSNSA